MLKIARYLILALVVVVLLSVLKGVGGAFRGGGGAMVLGDSVSVPGFESPPQFLKNVSSMASGFVSATLLGVTNSISSHVSSSIEDKATEEVMKNFNNLGDKEKEILRNAICVPPTPSD